MAGVGRVTGGEGILGLVRGYLQAGAGGVIASLWKVDDDATQALMVRFYELWDPEGATGLPAAEALRDAQAYVAAQEGWAHPTYWAGWQLWGAPDGR